MIYLLRYWYLVVIVALLGALGVGYLYLGIVQNAAEKDQIEAKAKISTLTVERDEARRVAQANEEAVYRIDTIYRGSLKLLSDQMLDVEQRVAALAELKEELANVPETNSCADSPAINLVLDRLQHRRSGAPHRGPSGAGQGAPSPTPVPLRPAGPQ